MKTEKNFIEPKLKIEYTKSGILSKKLFSPEKLNITLFCMSAGSKMDEHTSTMEGTVQVIEGTGEFTLEGKKIKMKQGVLIFMKKNAIHSLYAKTNLSFLLTLA